MRKWEKGILAIGNVHKGVDYATRMNLYNLIFEMVILDVIFSDRSGQESMFCRVSGQCGIGTRCQRRREAPIITVSTMARSAHYYHGVSGFALARAARASPSRRAARSRLVV